MRDSFWRPALRDTGLEKREYLSYSQNTDEIALMCTFKKAFNPRNILNPGKIFAMN